MSPTNIEIMNIGIIIVIVLILLVTCACYVKCLCKMPSQGTGRIHTEPDPASDDSSQETRLETLRRKVRENRWDDGVVSVALQLVAATDDPQDITRIIHCYMRPGQHYDSTTWNSDVTKIVWKRLAELCDADGIMNVLKEFSYMNSDTKAMFHKKWVAKANTFDEIVLIPTLYGDELLEHVRKEKLDRLAQEALTAAITCTEIVTMWNKIPTSSVLKSASVATLPAWKSDSNVSLSQIKAMAEQAPESSPIKEEADAKWLKLSLEKVRTIETVLEFGATCSYIHPEAKSPFVERWNRKSLDEVETAMTLETAIALTRYSPEDSTSEASARKRWSDLSLIAIQDACSFSDALEAYWDSPSSSEASAAGIVKCSSLASTEEEVRKVLSLDGVSEEIRKQLIAKFATLIGS